MSSLFPAAATAATPFEFRNHSVRVVMRNGEPWFVAADVAAALEYRDAEVAARHLPDRQKADTPIRCTSSRGTSQTRSMRIVSEGGLYRLVLRSRKPEAEAFTDWVTDEVLPAIRKTGTYAAAPAAQINDEALYAIDLLVTHFRALFEWATVNKVPQSLAWLGSPLGGELRDRLLDGMGGGVKAIERSIGQDIERAKARRMVQLHS